MGGILLHRFQLGLKLVARMSNMNINVGTCPGNDYGQLINYMHQCSLWNINIHLLFVKQSPNPVQ